MRKITYRERGQGPILILLHGYGGSVLHWEKVAESLQDRFRVIVPNLSHLYLSFDKLLFTVQVEILSQFIREHFPDDKVHLAGLSYGGALAWALSLQHPDLVEDLVLINPMLPSPIQHFTLSELKYFFSIPLNEKSIYFLLDSPIGKLFLKRAAKIFRDERTGGVLDVANLKGRKLQFVAHMIHHFSWVLRTEDWKHWWKRLPTMQVSTLLIFDRQDLLFGPDSYRELATQMRAEKVIELTGAGHLATKTRPETIAKNISDYLQKKSAA